MPITIDEPEVKRMYIGTRFADNVERGAQNLMIGAANKVRDLSKDQEGIHDDALRLMGGGIKNLRNWSKDQEGIHDDMLRLAGGGVKNTLKIAGLAGEVGGWLGGKAAGALGFDPRIGSTIGGVAGDLIPIAGVGAKALQISKTARRMSRLTKQGHGLQISQVLKASKGKPYAFAYGDAGKHALKDPNFLDAITANKKARKTIAKLAKQADDVGKAVTKPANKVFKTSEDWYAQAKQLSKEGFKSKDIMKKIGIYDDVKAGKRWTIHKDHDGITRVNLNNRDIRSERNLRRAVEQTGDRLNAYKSKVLDGGPGTNVHHMRPKKVIDVILDGAEGVDRQVLIDLAHDAFGGIGDTLGNLQQLSKPMHDQVHALLKKAGWDHKVMDPKKFKAMSMTDRVEAFYDFREAVQEINSWVIKQKQLGK